MKAGDGYSVQLAHSNARTAIMYQYNEKGIPVGMYVCVEELQHQDKFYLAQSVASQSTTNQVPAAGAESSGSSAGENTSDNSSSGDSGSGNSSDSSWNGNSGGDTGGDSGDVIKVTPPC